MITLIDFIKLDYSDKLEYFEFIPMKGYVNKNISSEIFNYIIKNEAESELLKWIAIKHNKCPLDLLEWVLLKVDIENLKYASLMSHRNTQETLKEVLKLENSDNCLYLISRLLNKLEK